MSDLKKFPANPPKFDIKVTARLIADFDKYSNGSICLTQGGGIINKDGAKVGSVSFALPAAVAVDIGARRYLVDFKEIFEAIYEAELVENRRDKDRRSIERRELKRGVNVRHDDESYVPKRVRRKDK